MPARLPAIATAIAALFAIVGVVNAADDSGKTAEQARNEQVIDQMTAPENTEKQPDGSVAAEGGPARPTENWTNNCAPDKGDNKPEPACTQGPASQRRATSRP